MPELIKFLARVLHGVDMHQQLPAALRRCDICPREYLLRWPALRWTRAEKKLTVPSEIGMLVNLYLALDLLTAL